TSPLDPEIARFIEALAAEGLRLSGGQPVSRARRREIAEEARKRWTEGGPDMAQTINARTPGGQRVRIHIPDGAREDAALLYLHGGGWTLFSIDTHDRLMREYADRSGLITIGLDYSLSPEVKFPVALDEIETCIDWIMTEGAGQDLAIENVFIGGDSAGGNLSLCTALRLRDRGKPLPAGLLLNYAALDMAIRESHSLYDGVPYMLETEEMKDFWTDYLSLGDETNPYARPLLADLAGLPPVHLCIAECDILLDENLELAKRLEQAGVEVDSQVYKGVTHSFLEAMSISERARTAIENGADWLKQQA
ncbi:MAG: alpha/beta hydrolase, partial [Henriciella sp.]|uniref:alpha/beta hydrolase n=1 Tax=Henriciella sp. TaxID=1968823 RepID=UPI003C722EAA